MNIRVLAVGTRMPGWVSDGVSEYLKRFPRDFKVEYVDLPVAQRAKNPDIKRSRQAEAKSIFSALKADETLIALDLNGKAWSTEQLAGQVQLWQQDHAGKVALVIGGPDGLDNEVLQQARQTWCLSPLTLPHPLVRVVVAEQLYRAWSLLNNHPYHK